MDGVRLADADEADYFYNRGPKIDIGGFFGSCLRAGFTLQLISLTCASMAFWLNGGVGLFANNLFHMSESGRNSQTFRTYLAIFTALHLIGSAYILSFQCLLADDACWARGYRAGSKLLRLGAFLDCLSAILQFSFNLYLAKFYSAKWFALFSEGGGSAWAFLLFSRLLHALVSLLYGASTYLLEAYHDEGAGALHAPLNATFFAIAACAELGEMMFLRSFCISSALFWLALLVTTIWAFFFEVEVNTVTPSFHQTELTNDIEQQIELYAGRNLYDSCSATYNNTQNNYANMASMNPTMQHYSKV